MWTEGLLLGLSTGSYCGIFCLPVALPFLLSEEITSFKQNALLVSLFLLGRFIVYLLLGWILGMLGIYTGKYLDPTLQHRLGAWAYLFIGVLMMLSGLRHQFPQLKICQSYSKIYQPARGAFFFGMLTAINFCPPLIAAVSRVFGQSGGMNGIIYFAMFFLGTAVYFLPFFGLAFIREHLEALKMIARLAMIFLGGYFILVLGLLHIIS